MKQWDNIFKKYGKVFTGTQEDIPRISSLFKKRNIKGILDLGSGTGRHIVYLAKQGFNVYGIDISEEGIKITKDWLRKEKLKANLRVGSIYRKLPYKDNFFDAVISINAVHHGTIKDIRKVIKEIERVLKPGGFIFINFRKRKFKKQWKAGKIIEKFGKQKVSYKVIAPRTYMPIEGGEKNLIHYLFNKKLIKKEFNNFKIHDIWIESNKRHYCLLAENRRK